MKIESILDLSSPLYSNCPDNPVLSAVKIERIATHAVHGYNLETISMPTHSGTHMDAPFHILPDGDALDKIILDKFLGPLIVMDMRHKKSKEAITPYDLSKLKIKDISSYYVIFHTGWAEHMGMSKEYIFGSPWLREDGAKFLVESGVKGVGIDHISISGMDDKTDVPCHISLLSKKIVILEGLYIPRDSYKRDDWYIFAFPLNISGASGSPVRPVAIAFSK